MSTSDVQDQTQSIQNEIQIEKIRAEINKLMAETVKIQSENRWYPFVIGSAVTIAIAAILKLFV